MISLRDMRHMDFKNPFVKKFTKFREKTNFFPKNLLRENFRGIFLFFFSRKLFRANFCANFSHEKYFRKDMTKKISRKLFFRDFGEKICAKVLTKKISRKKN